MPATSHPHQLAVRHPVASEGVLRRVLAVLAAAHGLAIWLDGARWPAALALVSLVSTAFVAVALWTSTVGLFVDLALLVVGAIVWRRRAGHHQPGGAS